MINARCERILVTQVGRTHTDIRVSTFLIRAEMLRAITAYPFDHPRNTSPSHSTPSSRLTLSLSSYRPVFLPLVASLALRPHLFLYPIFIQIHWEAPPVLAARVLPVRPLQTRSCSPPVRCSFFFSPTFSINSEFYLVRFVCAAASCLYPHTSYPPCSQMREAPSVISREYIARSVYT